eukprot:1142501-Rhodomonas_salina.3
MLWEEKTTRDPEGDWLAHADRRSECGSGDVPQPAGQSNAAGPHFLQPVPGARGDTLVVTKQTVFKWQDSFWLTLKALFDEHYKHSFLAKNLLSSNCELEHLLSDSAATQAIRWSGGGFGMVAHNYDGDVLSDEISQLHRGPAFMTRRTGG